MLELIKVEKSFGSTRVLQSLSLAIPPARTTVLLGPSGGGKSTVLRMMIGLIRPDAGAVHFDGTALTPANVPLLRRRMGYVVQDGGLFPHLTAAGNVTLMARRLGWPVERIRQR